MRPDAESKETTLRFKGQVAQLSPVKSVLHKNQYYTLLTEELCCVGGGSVVQMLPPSPFPSLPDCWFL